MRLTDENGITIKVNDAFCKAVDITKAELEAFIDSFFLSHT